MSLLTNKTVLILGVANQQSIAYSIAQLFAQQGARLAVSYVNERFGKRIVPLAESLGAELLLPCDVRSDQEIESLMTQVGEKFGRIDSLIHAIAFADPIHFNQPFSQTGREGFANALDVSCYSLIALSRAALPWMQEGGSIITMSYYGAEKVMPRYNIMGVAKAALEATVRYLSADLGQYNIRVNALSPGPIRTLSASAFRGFDQFIEHSAEHNPLRRSVEQLDVAQSALWLASDLSRAVTGEVIHVDAGYHVLGSVVDSER